MGPGLTWGRILSTCVISMGSNDRKCKYMFMFPLKNLARKELIMTFVVAVAVVICVMQKNLWGQPQSLPGPRFNIKMSYQYRKSHCGDKTVVRSSYLRNGISYTGKIASLYWFSPQEAQTAPQLHGCKGCSKASNLKSSVMKKSNKIVMNENLHMDDKVCVKWDPLGTFH